MTQHVSAKDCIDFGLASKTDKQLNDMRDIIEQEPLVARTKGRTAESLIHELLIQADEKGQAGNVAQYLVGAKLELRLGRDIPVQPANKSDRKSRSDPKAKLGNFEIESTVFEVAVGLPDEKHLEQIAEIIETSEKEVWLLTRADRAAAWKDAINGTENIQKKRVVLTSVEAFVGQTITELAEFSSKKKAVQLEALFNLYNTKWVEQVGTPGIKIVLK